MNKFKPEQCIRNWYNDHMLSYLIILILTIITKLFCIYLINFHVNRYLKHHLSSFLGAWLIFQILLVAWLLLTSAFSEMTTFTVWQFLVLMPICLLLYPRLLGQSISSFYKFGITLPKAKITLESAPLILLCLILLFLFIRSLLFFNASWGLMNYELSRVVFFASYKNLFIHQNIHAFSMFSYEWNGELNSLFYVLATNNDQGIAFGNVEFWLILILSFIWLCENLNIPRKFRLLWALTIATIPSVFSLVASNKSDLPTIALMAMAIGFILYTNKPINKQQRYLYWYLAIVTLSFAIGTKIVIIASAGLLILWCYYSACKKSKKGNCLKFILATTPFILITNARYIINYFVYGKPFIHTNQAHFTFSNLLANMKIILLNIAGVFHSGFDFWNHGYRFLYDAGYFTLAIVIVATTNVTIAKTLIIKKMQHKTSKNALAIWACLTFGFIFILIAINPKPWGARYFQTFTCLAFTWLAAQHIIFTSNKKTETFYAIIFLLTIIFNSFYCFYPKTAIMPQSLFFMVGKTQMQRKIIQLNRNNKLTQGMIKFLSDKHPKAILVVNSIDSKAFSLFGKNHINHVSFSDDITEINYKLSNQKFDLVLLSSSRINQVVKLATVALQNHGYHISSQNWFWRFYRKDKGCKE